MRGITWIALVGFVGGILSLAFGIPPGLRVFHLLAAGGAMAGYAIGDYSIRGIKSKTWRSILAMMALVLLFVSSIAYSVLIDENYSGVWIVIVLAFLLVLAFFSLTYLMALAGVIVQIRPGRKK